MEVPTPLNKKPRESGRTISRAPFVDTQDEAESKPPQDVQQVVFTRWIDSVQTTYAIIIYFGDVLLLFERI